MKTRHRQIGTQLYIITTLLSLATANVLRLQCPASMCLDIHGIGGPKQVTLGGGAPNVHYLM